MNFSELFIRRPVMTTLLMLSILLFGVTAYRQLPVSELPNVDYPTLLVQASLPGASPETMASAVATPLERQFSTISGLESMSSSSTLGNTGITLQFDLNKNIDVAAQDVQAAIATAARFLPDGMPAPPSYRKVNPADQPILYLALTSPTLPLYELNEYGETMMAQRISMVPGVAQVMVFGAQKYAVRIQLDPFALANRGIGIEEAAREIRKANVNLPTGILEGSERAFTLRSSGQLTEASAYLPVIIAYRNGAPVRLSDLGNAIDSVENDKTAAWFIDQRALVLAIQRQPGTNTVEVAGAIKKLLPEFGNHLPASASLNVLYDRSETVEESVTDIQFTLLFTLFLVMLVIFLFLRKLSLTLIPSLAMPMSIVGTFAVMYFMGYNLDNLSLMALILAVGFVVDDAIVMLENIVRHKEMGKTALQASLEGSREIGFTIVSMTLSLAAVFIPVLFMGGIMGRLFREFAVTIGAAVLISGFISLTLTPMLCSRFLKVHRTAGEHQGGVLFVRVLSLYGRMLRWFLAHRRFTMLFLGVAVILSAVLFGVIPKGFIPDEDRNQIFAPTEAAEGISWSSMMVHQQALAEAVRKNPNVESFMSSAGSRGGAVSGSNVGTMFIRLKHRSEREAHVQQVIQELRAETSQVVGIRAYFQNPPTIQVGGRFARSQYQYTLQSTDTEELYHYAPLLAEKMTAMPGVRDVTTDLQLKNPEVKIEIDRDKASALGVSAEQVEDALYTAYGSREISTIYAPTNQYSVIMQLEPQYQTDPGVLDLLYVRSAHNQLVPISGITKITQGYGPLSINHSGQLPSVTISFNLEPGFPLGDAVAALDRLSRMILPGTITSSFQGTAQAFQTSMKGLGILLILTIIVIYIVLGILYESFIHPVTILTALPLAGLGALATLLFFGMDLNVYAFVGLVMLVGLVKKNGIIMIDFAVEARKKGKGPSEAIYDACMVRFRPIMMTTISALVGTLPIAVGYGAGGESRQPLGLAVVGGLVFSQFLTLFVTPVFYTYMESLQEKVAGRVGSGRRHAGEEIAVDR
jgi:HAE1 family hydrophobic/amphiphilic exporter-1